MRIVNLGDCRLVVTKSGHSILMDSRGEAYVDWEDVNGMWVITEDDSTPELEIFYEDSRPMVTFH